MTEESINHIFLFLVKNCSYPDWNFKSAKEKYLEMKKAARSSNKSYYDTDWYIRPFEIEVSKLTSFLGIEKYDWNFIKPLYDKGLIWVNDGEGQTLKKCLNHLNEQHYNNMFKSIGQVKDYDTDIVYLHFWLGNHNPNHTINKSTLTNIK
jgi:hypothetical protein